MHKSPRFQSAKLKQAPLRDFVETRLAKRQGPSNLRRRLEAEETRDFPAAKFRKLNLE